MKISNLICTLVMFNISSAASQVGATHFFKAKDGEHDSCGYEEDGGNGEAGRNGINGQNGGNGGNGGGSLYGKGGNGGNGGNVD
jgi:hypothetical protein